MESRRIAEPFEPPPGHWRGRVKWFDPNRGYGFIAPDDGGKDVFVHVTGLAEGVVTLQDGEQVVFKTEETEKGLQAVNVTIALG